MIETYRDYDISFSNGRHVARPLDGEPFEIRCHNANRLKKAIDDLWDTTSQIQNSKFEVEELPAPRWIRDLIANPTNSIDLDAAYARGAC